MAEPETTYEEKARQLNILRQKAAEAERQAAELEKELQRERKVALEYRKNLTRHPTCEKIINRYVLISAGVGLLLPFPGIDVAALTGLQIKMIDSLAEQFGRNYTEAEARHTLTALTGGLAAPLAAPAVASAAVVVPLVEPLISIAARPGFAAASTRMVGHLALERLQREEKLAPLDPYKHPEAVAVATTAQPIDPPNPKIDPAKAKTPPDLTPQIAKRAYELYEREGHRDGHAVQDWGEAEREIRKDESPK
jgi:uncharacterized protein (DUF697 family)